MPRRYAISVKRKCAQSPEAIRVGTVGSEEGFHAILPKEECAVSPRGESGPLYPHEICEYLGGTQFRCAKCAQFPFWEICVGTIGSDEGVT